MKPHLNTTSHRAPVRGFALIVTLSLMILLTVIAVGLLTLSAISMRSSAQADAMNVARTNARLAMMLALGDLQKTVGPDTRISATADQIAGPGGEDSTTPRAHRQWAGAYRSWPTAPPKDTRPAPEFLQWFVSGNPDQIIDKEFAATSSGTSSGTTVEMATRNTVSDADPVVVPSIASTSADGSRGNLAWWVSDLGTKALVGAAKEIPSTFGDTRADQQSAPANDLTALKSGANQPFAKISGTDPLLANVISARGISLLADQPENTRELFHDLTANSRGLLTNVREGGFRRDLSMQLERNSTNAPSPSSSALYTVGGEVGINLHELWAYYNLSAPPKLNPSGLKRAGAARFTTGGTMASGTPYLQVQSSPAACQTDDSFYFKQPVIVSYQLALSFQNRVDDVSKQSVLHIVADPILTFWNPLDVPVVIPPGSFISVKYWQVPYDLQISKNGGGYRNYPMAASLSGATTGASGDANFVSLVVGQTEQLAFKPGEVIKMSQVGKTIAKSSIPDPHKLGGGKGFNYGGGMSVPVRDLSGATIPLAPTDTIAFRATSNNLTAGSTGSSGHSITGGAQHSRHLSLTHHEYFVGLDRGNNTNSLGIGGMYIDWDFGNRRLRASETRSETGPGTKKANERLYANQFPRIFVPISGRPLSATVLTDKQPFMLMSFNAKTEAGSDRGTRSLSRFNPKALHVDFYDLTDRERDMLPYEYTVEPLSSWKNRSLEQSSNGNAYFGGGMDAANGSSFVTTHSVPREPLISLAAFQHSFANGFDTQRPKWGYAILNGREPMLPQISHAIGNSYATPLLAKNQVEGTLSGGRPLADHSYLANQALWDTWFLSGIAPQSSATFAQERSQRIVAMEFFNGTGELPVARYQPNLRGQDATRVAAKYLSGAYPSNTAIDDIASLIVVDGMFNVNSTSVEAWKSLLGGRKDRPILVRNDTGKESIEEGDDTTPVAGLLAPMDEIAPGNGSADLNRSAQWNGRRTLDDEQIDRLARSIVREVRKRGPFLSLADFVNRRVGNDNELARCGAIQAALDSPEAEINTAYQSGERATTAGSNFAFPAAEAGAISQGIPGIVKQADILTPIAPILSARSDSFLIRAYGEKKDNAGKVIARAWCEAVVQRNAEFVDPSDPPEKTYSSINTTNETFGRRFDIVSFRWLTANEI